MLLYNSPGIPLVVKFGLKPHCWWLSPTPVTSTSTPTVTATLLTVRVQSNHVEVRKHLRAVTAQQSVSWSVQAFHPTLPCSTNFIHPSSLLGMIWIIIPDFFNVTSTVWFVLKLPAVPWTVRTWVVLHGLTLPGELSVWGVRANSLLESPTLQEMLFASGQTLFADSLIGHMPDTVHLTTTALLTESTF